MAFYQLPRFLLADDRTASPFPSPLASSTHSPSPASVRPSIAVIIGVLTTMFSFIFLLLLYARHCKRQAVGGSYDGAGAASVQQGRNSGVKRSVVESLPVFRFGSLAGQKEGLECAVCLGRFEPAELLRLLPKCKHGFHVECVDIWLEAHSTCPLCRVRVRPEDVLLVIDPRPNTEPEPDAPGIAATLALSVRRISGRHSSAGEKRIKPAQAAESRRSEGCKAPAVSVGCFDRVRKDGLLLTESAAAEREEFERRFSHRIIVGDGGRGRWSDLRPSDLLYLRSEMIISDGSRMSASKGGGKGVNNMRSVSEITGLSRFQERESERLVVRPNVWGGGGATGLAPGDNK